MARLLHHFTPLFSYGLALDEKVSVNQASEPAAAGNARARGLVDRGQARGRGCDGTWGGPPGDAGTIHALA